MATRIISNLMIHSGAPVIAGTGVRAEIVLAEVAAGRSAAAILATYPALPPDAVEACLDWDKAGRPLKSCVAS